jgi:nucleoside-diphosphate-sugar epimerase
MLVLVTGGTGFVGSHSVAAIVRDGHRVRLLARDESRVRPALDPLGVDPGAVEVVAGDVADGPAVQAAVAGCDAVLHAASVFSFDSRAHAKMRAVNASGTETVLAAARRAGADPIVHVSTFAALVPTHGRPLSTDSPVGQPRETYMATKAEAEEIARRHQDEGAPVTITYLPAMIGPHDPYVGDQSGRLRDVLRGLMPIWPLGGHPIGDVRDTAALHAAALVPGQGPRRFFGPGRYVTTREYIRTARRVTDRALPTVFLPARSMFPIGMLTMLLQRVVPFHIPAEYGAIYTCATAARLDDSTAGALGIQPRPLAETMADAVRWLHEHGEVSDRQAGAAVSPRPAAAAR